MCRWKRGWVVSFGQQIDHAFPVEKPVSGGSLFSGQLS